MAHKHAELMKLYAEDAMETDKPWERWEFKPEECQAWVPLGTNPNWGPLGSNPNWHEYFEYRRRRKVILVNGVKVPAPEVVAPADGTQYYVPDVIREDKYNWITWRGDKHDCAFLEQTLVYLIKEDAIARAKAMLKTETV